MPNNRKGGGGVERTYIGLALSIAYLVLHKKVIDKAAKNDF
jgi:hypothetical protein